jgi:hypothetical protein
MWLLSGVKVYILSVAPGIFGERIAIILGFITLTAFLAILASCRSCMSLLKFLHIKVPFDSKPYQVFNKYHNYYWWAFGYMLVVHAYMAFVHTGIPAADDPDAGVHWIILWFGVGSVVSASVTLFSCRSLVFLINLLKGKSPLTNKVYRGFFNIHGYYWLVLILAAAGHVAAAFSHAGVWPAG